MKRKSIAIFLLFFPIVFIYFLQNLYAQKPLAINIGQLRNEGYNKRFTDTASCFTMQFQALQEAKKTNRPAEVAISYAVLSLSYKRLLKTGSAQLYADSAFYLAQEVKTPQALGYAYMASGLLKSYLDEDDSALGFLIKAYDCFAQTNDAANKEKVAAALSYEYATAGHRVQVEKYARMALGEAASAGTWDEILEARLAYGSLLIAKNRDEKLTADTAINYFKQTIAQTAPHKESIYNKSNSAIVYLNLAVLYYENPFKGSESFFLASLDSAVALAKQYNIRTVYRNSLGLKGEYLSVKKEYAAAEKLFKESIAYQKTLPFHDSRVLLLLYSSLKNLAVKQEKYRAYVGYDSFFLKYNKLQYSEATQQAMQNADAKFETSLKAARIKALENENNLQRSNKWLGYGASILLGIGLFLLIVLYYFRQKYYMQSELVMKEKQQNTELALQVKEQENMEVLTQKLSMERRLLQSQMDPHFVFNALGNIQSFVLRNDNMNAVAYLSTFSKLMRQILSHSKKETITLADEISMLKNYMELQKLRLNHSFNYSIDVANLMLEDVAIPPMLVQPFIENAIEHGLKPLSNDIKGSLQIRFEAYKNETLLCTINDNGIGYNVSKTKKNKADGHKSMAMDITTERMQNMAKQNNGTGFEIVEIKDADGVILGTSVTIVIPHFKNW